MGIQKASFAARFQMRAFLSSIASQLRLSSCLRSQTSLRVHPPLSGRADRYAKVLIADQGRVLRASSAAERFATGQNGPTRIRKEGPADREAESSTSDAACLQLKLYTAKPREVTLQTRFCDRRLRRTVRASLAGPNLSNVNPYVIWHGTKAFRVNVGLRRPKSHG
jgi:hypothetical protein